MKSFIKKIWLFVAIISFPVIYVLLFINTLPYEIQNTLKTDYMSVITNEYAHKQYIEPPIDKDLDAALKKCQYEPLPYSQAILILYQTDKSNSKNTYIYHGNYDSVYIDGQKFFYGYLIFTESDTYLFAEYSKESNSAGINKHIKTLYRLVGIEPLKLSEFKNIDSSNKKMLTSWFHSCCQLFYAQILKNYPILIVFSIFYILFVTILTVSKVKKSEQKS